MTATDETTTRDDTIKVVLYSHDSQGLGHVRRNLAIAHHLAMGLPALTGQKVSGLLISGLAPTMRFPLPSGFDWVTIPGVAKGKQGYTARSLGSGTGRLIHLRSQLIEAALLGFTPDLVIIDRHIYGVWNELRTPLAHLRETHPHTKIVLGLREILDEPHVAMSEWEALGDPDLMRGIVDEVWVYGDPKIHSIIASGEAPQALADRIRFTGYLARGRRVTDAATGPSSGAVRESEAGAITEGPIEPGPFEAGAIEAAVGTLVRAATPARPFILSTAGGGQDGQIMLEAAVRASVPATHTHMVVTGPQMSDADYEHLVAMARPGTRVVRSLPGLGRHISQADAVIAMGGYNTVCEILATTTPALIIPREQPRQEQHIRAQALARVGALDYLRTSQLTAEALSAWLGHAIGHSTRRDGVDRDGLTRIPRIAHNLMTSTRAAA